ncbi:MAG TPA: hypothetical protein VF895_06285 [Gaiellaceae bacterium]
MASVEDVLQSIDDVNARLGGDLANPADNVNGHLAAVEGLATQIRDTVKTGFAELVAIGNYTNQALYHVTEQNETIICNLEKLTSQTCRLLNEAHTQTGLQTSIERETGKLGDMFSTVHADAALDLERRQELKREIEKCCPPKLEPPVCVYEPCEKPARITEPPEVGTTEDKEQPPK